MIDSLGTFSYGPVSNHQFGSYLFGTWKNLTDARDIETSYKK